MTAPLEQEAVHGLERVIVGWDIGGANIKAARLGPDGIRVLLRPFAIWQQRDRLPAVLADMAAQLGPTQCVAVTMTAELSDIFRTKREGVAFVLDAVRRTYPQPEVRLRVFGVDGQFHPPETAYNNPLLVAAANWLATAQIVARRVPTCLLVDVGSTTTDTVPIAGGRVVAQGRNDPERLVRGELLYTGALRTPICAVVHRVPLWGHWCPVAAELFATTQDVHLLLGTLTPDQCTAPTADGRPATPVFAAERLARVVCADAEMLAKDDILAIARHVADVQVHQIAEAILQVISGSGVQGPLVAAGVGAFLVHAAAERLGVECQSLAAALGEAASQAAPAAALALLLAEQHDV